MAREKVEVVAKATVDKEDYDRLVAEGFKPIVRWVEVRSEVALKTMDAVNVIRGRARARRDPANPHRRGGA